MARILVADDDDLLCEFLRIRLTVSGHSVAVAQNGLSALDHLIAGNFDLILLDDVMPGLSGWEVLEAAKKLPKLTTKFIVMSQLSPTSVLAKAKNLGVAAILQKPFCPDELSILVRTHCEAPVSATLLRSNVRTAFASTVLAITALSTTAHAQDGMLNTSVAQSTGYASISSNNGNASASEAVPRDWTISASHQWSWISNTAQSRWQDTQISAEYAPKKNALYSAELNQSFRFGLTDHLVAIRGDWRIARNASVYAGIATSPEGNFREKWGIRAGGGVGLGHGIELSADGRIANYISGTKFSLNPQLGVTFADERIALSAGWINLWESGGKHYQGWSARLRASPDDRLRLFAGVARYPEVETGITRRVRSAFGGFSFKLSRRAETSVSYARDNYEGAFSRKALTIGLRWKLSDGH